MMDTPVVAAGEASLALCDVAGTTVDDELRNFTATAVRSASDRASSYLCLSPMLVAGSFFLRLSLSSSAFRFRRTTMIGRHVAVAHVVLLFLPPWQRVVCLVQTPKRKHTSIRTLALSLFLFRLLCVCVFVCMCVLANRVPVGSLFMSWRSGFLLRHVLLLHWLLNTYLLLVCTLCRCPFARAYSRYMHCI